MDHLGSVMALWICLIFGHVLWYGVEGKGLSYDFYEKSCPQVENIIRSGLQPIFSTDIASPAALLRLMFHDCQVQMVNQMQGCDASILVDPGEENASSEMGSTRNSAVRKRESISVLKSMVEAVCPQQVSCADILILAAREAVAVSGGPHIKLPLGRRDSPLAPRHETGDALLPSSTVGVDEMLRIFAEKGMSFEEFVAISISRINSNIMHHHLLNNKYRHRLTF